MLFPAIAVAGPLLVIETSTWTVMVVFVVELFLPDALPSVVDETVAVLLIMEAEAAAGDTCTVMVNVALAPAANDAMLQETVAPVVQVKVGPVVCISETNEVLAGNTSVQATFAAFEGPALATVMV